MKTKASNTNAASRRGLQKARFLSLQGKKSWLLCGLVLLCGSAFTNKEAVDWKLDTTVKGVQFYHAVSGCNGRQVTFLKFVNKNSYPVNVSWKELVKTQLRTEENLFRGGQHLLLPPGETFADNCAATCKACVLTSEGIVPTYPAQVISYTFKNIIVEKETKQ